MGGYVLVTCSYYNTGNYATIEDRTTDDKQINYKDRYNSSAVFLCGAEDVVGKPGNPGCGE